MPKKPDQKLRLLYMKEILERYTDEEHGISRKEFETQLSHGSTLRRKHSGIRI